VALSVKLIRLGAASLVAGTLFSGAALAEPARIPEQALPVARQLQQKALAGSGAFQIVESLSTEVGPRMFGTPGDAAAVAWAVAKLKELGFDKVWTEPVAYPGWVRGTERATVTAPFPQPLHVTALGYTLPTPPGGVEAEIVRFASYEDMLDAAPDSLAGKIVFIAQPMVRHIEGLGYGHAVAMRGDGPIEAAKRGAAALLIRSVGTDHHRFPHTGVTEHDEGVPRIPAAALSVPDAEQLERLLARGKPVTVKLELTPEFPGPTQSFNVIGEVRGREAPEEVVVLGAHLDSWDLGTGAVDDGAGVAIVTAAAKLIRDLPQRPRRTVRVVLFAAEEIGLVGAKAYAEAHKGEMARHVIGVEADFGAGPVYAFNSTANPAADEALKVIRRALSPLNVVPGGEKASGGPDVGILRRAGMPVVDLELDGTDYFDVHHTADDTLDKVDPKKIDQATAAFATFAYLAAESTGSFGPIEIPPAKQ